MVLLTSFRTSNCDIKNQCLVKFNLRENIRQKQIWSAIENSMVSAIHKKLKTICVVAIGCLYRTTLWNRIMLVSLTIQKGYQVSWSSCICRSATRRIGNRLTKQLCPPLEAKALLQFITQNSSSLNISAPSPCKQHGIDFAHSSEFRDWSTWWSLKAGKVLRWFQNSLIEKLLWLPHIKNLNFRVRIGHQKTNTIKQLSESTYRKHIKKQNVSTPMTCPEPWRAPNTSCGNSTDASHGWGSVWPGTWDGHALEDSGL